MNKLGYKHQTMLLREVATPTVNVYKKSINLHPKKQVRNIKNLNNSRVYERIFLMPMYAHNAVVKGIARYGA